MNSKIYITLAIFAIISAVFFYDIKYIRISLKKGMRNVLKKN